MNQPNSASTGAAKPAKRSIFGLLFNPQLGNSIRPLGESNKIFIHLLASVFALYGLLPRNYPGLRDQNARMSLTHVMGTAWGNVNFTREGAPKAILFFAILGIMAFGLLAALSALLSIFIGQAHAQGGAANASEFVLPGGNSDVAQAWIDYLFLGTPLPNYYNQMGATVPTSLGLQAAVIQVLAFYSDAILIIAAMVLFYHLTAMVLETAHHGQVMGKRANQMWAPIRLVVAIGLLVPINTGLNSGQYIVIKMAEVGSALATNAWNLFLTALTSYNMATIAPQAPVVSRIAVDMMAIDACVYDYNLRVVQFMGTTPASANAQIPPAGVQTTMQVGGVQGVKYSFSPKNMVDQDVCGWYFIPTPDGSSAAATAAYAAEATAFSNAMNDLQQDATIGPTGIQNVMPQDVGGTAFSQPLQISPKTVDDIIKYQVQLGDSMNALAAATSSTTAQAVNQLRPYGWVTAGALWNMVSRIQAMISNAVTAGIPQTHPPLLLNPNSTADGFRQDPLFDDKHATTPPMAGDIRAQVAIDMQNYSGLVSKDWANTSAANVQCASMIGLQSVAQGAGWGADVIHIIFHYVDRLAEMTGVWTSGIGQPCGGLAGGVAAGLNTFNVGIQQINGGDPLAEIAHLGHANLDVAFQLLTISTLGKGISAAAASLLNLSNSPTFGTIGSISAAVVDAAGGILDFLAMVFMVCGFTLAFVLPMFPFTRFFFAVLVWVAALLEAVVAVPLIAMAHLNPEGEGLPGASARASYFYVFNILLRPILCLFGLCLGMLLFLIATNFLTYTFNLAVASSGGTAYGHEVMAKVIYSIIYVVMLYTCANHSFALIDHIPEKALSWLGAQAQSMANIGNAAHMSQAENLIGSYAGQQMMGNIGNATGKLTQGMQSGTAGLAKAQAEARAAEAASQVSRAKGLDKAAASELQGAIGPAASKEVENIGEKIQSSLHKTGLDPKS